MPRLPPGLPSGLIVSCQAREGNPLRGSTFMAAMALAAEAGGAVAVRVEGPEDIRAVKAAVSVPVIGLWKVEHSNFEPYITPTLESAQAVADAGADLVAVDATLRPHPEGSAADLIRAVKDFGLEVFADVSTVEEGVAAAEAGAAYISTTMAGYTPYTETGEGPDLELVHALVRAVSIPIVAEGRFWTPEQVAEAFALGAHAVVIGTAITNPMEITKRFVQATL